MSDSENEITFKNVENEDGRGDEPPPLFEHTSTTDYDTVDESGPDEPQPSTSALDRSPSIRGKTTPRRKSRRDIPKTQYLGINYNTSNKHNTRPKRPDVRLRSFSGDDDSDWEQFHEHFEVVAEIGGWGIRSMLLALRSCMKGKADQFLSNLPPAVKASYRLLVEAFSTRFNNPRQQPMWVSTFKNRTRGPSEQVTTFADDLSRLAKKAYADLDYMAQERMALDQLYGSITPELRLRCIDRDCRTVDQAVEVIRTYEGIIGSNNTGRGSQSQVRMVTTRPQTKCRQEQRLSTDADNILKELQQRVEDLERLNRQLGQQNRRQRPQQAYNPRHGPQNVNHGPPRCFGCQSTAHFYRDCPTNPINHNDAQPNIDGQNNQENEHPSPQ